MPVCANRTPLKMCFWCGSVHRCIAQAAAAAGIVSSILDSMRAHAQDQALAAAACGVLGVLSAKHTEIQMQIATAGGIACILRVLREHSEHAVAMIPACGVLRNLATCPENQLAIAAGGGVAVIVDAMSDNAESEVLAQVCRVLVNLAKNNTANQVVSPSCARLSCVPVQCRLPPAQTQACSYASEGRAGVDRCGWRDSAHLGSDEEARKDAGSSGRAWLRCPGKLGLPCRQPS